MSFIRKPREENTPYTQLLILVGLTLGGFIVCSVVAVIIIVALYGARALTDPTILSGAQPQYRPALQILLIASSAGTFLVPALLLALTEGKSPGRFYQFKRPHATTAGLVLLIMVAAMPFMEWVMVLNQKMVLPGFLKGLEVWIREKEDAALQTTLLLLKMDHLQELLLNLFMIALLPAIAEELMFRGGVQRSLARIFKSPHAAIWVSAAIFSAIHMQFYGFLPRLLLGAGFGYIYFWSGSLWYAMLAHFINNAYAICAAWYMQRHHMPLDKIDDATYFTWYGYLISFVLTLLLFRFFRTYTLKTNNDQ